MPGWLKMYRKITEWEWYTDSQTVHLFIHIIIKASFEDSKWRGQNIKRGQLFTGRKLLSQQTGISEQSIRTILNRLKSTEEITIESTSKNSIITVCNYERYQAEYQQTNQQINQQTNQQSTSDQPATNHIKEIKKLKKEKKDPFCLEPSAEASNPVVEIILNSKKLYPLLQKDIDDWQDLFPAVDVLCELRKMAAWSEANTAKRKTDKGIRRFIVSWLSKEQDSGHRPLLQSVQTALTPNQQKMEDQWIEALRRT